MSEELQNSIQKIRKLTPKLNTATDDAGRVVAAVEKFLGEQCAVGMPAQVDAGGAPDDVLYQLRYARHNGKFRILIVVQMPDPADVQRRVGTLDLSPVLTRTSSVTPWSESPRSEKLATLNFLPNLLNTLAENIAQAVQNAENASETVSAIMQAMSNENYIGVAAPDVVKATSKHGPFNPQSENVHPELPVGTAMITSEEENRLRKAGVIS